MNENFATETQSHRERTIYFSALCLCASVANPIA